jgi:hypothetical protein
MEFRRQGNNSILYPHFITCSGLISVRIAGEYHLWWASKFGRAYRDMSSSLLQLFLNSSAESQQILVHQSDLTHPEKMAEQEKKRSLVKLCIEMNNCV